MRNRLLEPVEYKTETTSLGVWKRFGYETGMTYHEFTSHTRLFGLPLIHHTSGVNPETGRRKTARGVFAFGKVAVGVVAVGHVGIGLVAVGQLALGLLLGLGQACFGAVAVGQLSVGLLFGLGQLAIAPVAIGQIAVGYYALGQIGVGEHIHSAKIKDPAALEFFSRLPFVKTFFK